MSVFGEYFRSRREQLGLSQREAAKRLDVSVNTVARWEHGKAMPSSAQSAGLRDVLGISRARVADLVRGQKPPPDAAETEARIAELEDRIAELEEQCAQPITSLEDQFGNTITLGPTGICIDSPSEVKIEGTTVEIDAGILKILSAMVSASGVIQSQAVVTEAIVATTYSPGAGNIW